MLPACRERDGHDHTTLCYLTISLTGTTLAGSHSTARSGVVDLRYEVSGRHDWPAGSGSVAVVGRPYAATRARRKQRKNIKFGPAHAVRIYAAVRSHSSET